MTTTPGSDPVLAPNNSNNIIAVTSVITTSIPNAVLSSLSLLPSFPADHLLFPASSQQQHQQHQQQHSLPNWNVEIYKLHGICVGWTIIWWFLLVPKMIRFCSARKQQQQQQQQKRQEQQPSRTVPTASTRTGRTRSIFSTFAYIYNYIVLPITIVVTTTLGYLASMIIILTFVSSYNTYLAKRVFTIPILTPNECQYFIQMAQQVAQRNIDHYSQYDTNELSTTEYKMLYQKPYGWNKVRHEHYATTDLNVLVKDPFRQVDRNWFLEEICNTRIVPVLSRIYGIPPRSIQARDIFIVRYDYYNSTEDRQFHRNQLHRHTDGGDISFTIYLNDNFTGGGTQFWNLYTKTPFHLLQPNQHPHEMSSVGQLSFFHALIPHEGYPITSGQRIILVGFLNVVTTEEGPNPDTTTIRKNDTITELKRMLSKSKATTSTGLSIYASYLNWSWIMVRITDWFSDYEFESSDWRKTMKRYLTRVVLFLARISTHTVTPLLVFPTTPTANHTNNNQTERHQLQQQQQQQQDELLSELIQVLEADYDPNLLYKKARWLEYQQKKWDEEEDEEEDEDDYDYNNKDEMQDDKVVVANNKYNQNDDDKDEHEDNTIGTTTIIKKSTAGTVTTNNNNDEL